MTPADDPWSERAADLYEFFFDRDGAHRDAERLHGLIRERTPDARSLLDVACGTGWHLERLREWYEVEGVDRSPAMLRYARDRLPDVALHEGDMRSFDLGQTFDVVSCLSSSIAWMRSTQDLRRAVEAMGTHVRKDGLLLIEPWDFPADAPSDEPWVATKQKPDRVVTLMETTTFDGDVWVQETHWLDRKRPGRIEHLVEVHTLGAFERSDHVEAFVAAGLDVEFDTVGLLGRGLFIGTRR
jgi:SAM-dependent methyltransferase